MNKVFKFSAAALTVVAVSVVLLSYFFPDPPSESLQPTHRERERSQTLGSPDVSPASSGGRSRLKEMLPTPTSLTNPLNAPDVSRKYITSIRSSQEAALVHRKLTVILLERLVALSKSKHGKSPDRIRLAIEEIVDRYYLLNESAKQYKFEAPGKGSISTRERPWVDHLVKAWRINSQFAIAVDEEFNRRGLKGGREHTRELLQDWMK